MSARPRVLQVLQPDDGGVRQHVLQLAHGLGERGWAVEVAASRSAGPGSSYRAALEAAGATVHVLPFRRAPGPDDVRAMVRLRALDAERPYDVVHAHSSKAGAVVRAALPERRRLLYTPHCFAFAAALGASRGAYWLAEQLLLPRGTLIASSEWERRTALRSLLGARRVVRRVRYGVDEGAAHAPDPRLAALPRPVAGFLARLEPQKDPLALVAAAGELHDRGRLAGSVAIVGSGALEGDVRAAIAARGLGERVTWLPFEGPVERYLRGFDLYVLPSRWESLPIGILEAMACGLPVLATDVGGSAEAIRDGVTGRVVPPEDTAALAGALGELLADPERLAAMGRAGRELMQREFSSARMVGELEALYRERMAA